MSCGILLDTATESPKSLNIHWY